MARRVLEEDLKNIEFETSEDVDVTPTFDHMGLREDLLRGIYAYGLYNFIRSQVRNEEVNNLISSRVYISCLPANVNQLKSMVYHFLTVNPFMHVLKM